MQSDNVVAYIGCRVDFKDSMETFNCIILMAIMNIHIEGVENHIVYIECSLSNGFYCDSHVANTLRFFLTALTDRPMGCGMHVVSTVGIVLSLIFFVNKV